MTVSPPLRKSFAWPSETHGPKHGAIAAPLDAPLLAFSALFRFLIGTVALAYVYGSSRNAIAIIIAITALFSTIFCLMDMRLVRAVGRVKALRVARERGFPIPEKTFRLKRVGVWKRITLSLTVMSLVSVLFELVLFQKDIQGEIERRFIAANRVLIESVTMRIQTEVAQAETLLNETTARENELVRKADSIRNRPADTKAIDAEIGKAGTQLSEAQNRLRQSEDDVAKQKQIAIGEDFGQCDARLPCTGKKGRAGAYGAAMARLDVSQGIAESSKADIRALEGKIERQETLRAALVASARSEAEAEIRAFQVEIDGVRAEHAADARFISQRKLDLSRTAEIASHEPGYVPHNDGLVAQVAALEVIVTSSPGQFLLWLFMTVTCSAGELAPLLSLGTTPTTLAAVSTEIEFETACRKMVAEAVRSGDLDPDRAKLERELGLLELRERVELKRRGVGFIADLAQAGATPNEALIGEEKA